MRRRHGEIPFVQVSATYEIIECGIVVAVGFTVPAFLVWAVGLML